MKCFWLLLCGMVLQLYGQDSYPEAISDNSFLIEEAFNQEHRVVQHIFNFSRIHPQKNWELSFSQEWPLFSQKHQLSYRLSHSWLSNNTVRGIGDISVDYRYQLLDADAWAAVAPRFSVFLPSGNEKKDLGMGVPGYQLNLPVSKRLHDHWIVHFNAGGTLWLNAKSENKKHNLLSGHAGVGIYWLWLPNLNVMLEWFSSFDDTFASDGKVKNRPTHIINPGLRFAVNAGSLQIVPGFCIPLQVNGKDKTTTAMLYLSAEHPF